MRNGLSYSEAGKIGAEKSKIRSAIDKQKRIDEYNLNPRLCNFCNTPLQYINRRNKFCNHSCAASNNNKNVQRNLLSGKYVKKPCMICGKESKNKFCSHNCEKKFQWEERKKEFEQNGFIKGCKAENLRFFLKRYLIEIRGHRCEICELTEWTGFAIPLILDHINGHSEDNSIKNLRLVCGNCDMLLPTYKAKNRGNGRAYRRQRYLEGKSY